MRKKNKTHRNAVIIGFFVCSLIISASLYLAYIETLHEAKMALIKNATKTSHKVQLFFNETNSSLLKIIKYNKCTTTAKEKLKALVLNSPQLSIAYLKTSNTLCSSVKNLTLNESYSPKKSKLKLQGPLDIDKLISNAYQLKISNGKTEAGVIIPFRVLSELLSQNTKNLITHSLYNETSKIFLFPPTNQSVSIHENGKMSTINKLSIINNVHLYSYISSKWIFNKLKPHLFYASIISLLICLIFATILRKITIHKLSLASELRVALRNEQFIPYYQPVIELSTGKFSGVECLMRWLINEDEIIQPDIFISCAERTQLIKPMTEQLICQIFQDLGPYAQKNENFHIAINLSPIHFRDRDTFQQIKHYCDHYQLKPEQIILELTEQELINENDELALTIMKDMRQTGFSLAIDDFGTGYSSINYLSRYPFNFLKIDKQFIMAIGSNAITAQLADSMIDLAKNLNLQVIAEGIEKHSQEKHLKDRFITYGQGWLYSKALSFSELQQFIENRNNHRG